MRAHPLLAEGERLVRRSGSPSVEMPAGRERPAAWNRPSAAFSSATRSYGSSATSTDSPTRHRADAARQARVARPTPAGRLAAGHHRQHGGARAIERRDHLPPPPRPAPPAPACARRVLHGLPQRRRGALLDGRAADGGRRVGDDDRRPAAGRAGPARPPAPRPRARSAIRRRGAPAATATGALPATRSAGKPAASTASMAAAGRATRSPPPAAASPSRPARPAGPPPRRPSVSSGASATTRISGLRRRVRGSGAFDLGRRSDPPGPTAGCPAPCRGPCPRRNRRGRCGGRSRRPARRRASVAPCSPAPRITDRWHRAGDCSPSPSPASVGGLAAPALAAGPRARRRLLQRPRAPR